MSKYYLISFMKIKDEQRKVTNYTLLLKARDRAHLIKWIIDMNITVYTMIEIEPSECPRTPVDIDYITSL